MSGPVERLTAAIEKLERLKAESSLGPWKATDRRGVPALAPYEADIDALGLSEAVDWRVADVIFASDAELIVTLHRTIDAQLAILRRVLDIVTPIDGQASYDIGPGSRVGQALALADTILGGQS